MAKPYSFEPRRVGARFTMDKSSYRSNADENERDNSRADTERLLNSNWCICGQCHVMPTAEECVRRSVPLSPIRRNSVLEELRVRRLAVIQDEICCRAFCKWLMLEWKCDGSKERKSCVSSAYRWWFKERDETRVLSGVLYMIKSRGPRTEPWGTPQRQVCGEEKSLLHSTRKQRESIV